ncbi:MAG: hypothetical protein C0399_07420 [Syntrophus sp. (in: bacteria)]|nr:hypothetical protein [Syntrophus sp. (in: bacteria)]
MKKGILIVSICVMVLMVSLPAMSYAWGRGHHRGYYRGYGWGPAAAGGFIAGAVIGNAFARPYYVEPPPVYVGPPPPVVYYYPPPRPYGAYAYPY